MSSTKRSFIIGTAGHIDHGKTVLVKALTGHDTDRLQEEKKRGISIDLGFAPLRLKDGSIAGIVDVPGHENFVRNMLAGATGVDLALLVVAADDGVMPQTREHLAILDLLGVDKGIVALTKIDLVDEEMVQFVTEEIKEILSGTALRGSPVVPVSAFEGVGINELMEEIEKASHVIRHKNEELPVRMPIDRVFTLKGIGTIVTGTLWSGTLRVGEKMVIEPRGIEVRVRSIEVHGQQRNEAIAGERTAANLAQVSKYDISRGDVLLALNYLKPCYMLDARVTLLKDTKELKRGARIRFHHGTKEVMGRIYPLDGNPINPGESKPAQIRLESQVVCAPGDRFVIRSYSPVTTIGGGKVIDISPKKHKVVDTAAIEEFHILESKDTPSALLIHLSRIEKPQNPRDIGLTSGLPTEKVRECLSALCTDGKIVPLEGKENVWYILKKTFEEKSSLVLSILSEHARLEPLEEGMDKETLKRRALENWDDKPADLFLEKLTATELIEAKGKIVRLAGRRIEISAEDSEMLSKIVSIIEQGGTSPPSTSEISSKLSIERNKVEKLLALGEKDGSVVKVSPDLYFSTDVIISLQNKLLNALSEKPDGITVGDFKKLAATSRKYAVPLLEYFDRKRITIRLGNLRKPRIP